MASTPAQAPSTGAGGAAGGAGKGAPVTSPQAASAHPVPANLSLDQLQAMFEVRRPLRLLPAISPRLCTCFAKFLWMFVDVDVFRV